MVFEDGVLETPNLLVRRMPAGSETCVVTFSNYADTIDLAAPAFGERFLHQHGIDAVHVIARGNDWFQYPEMPSVLAAIRAATAGKRLVTYGSSMGGYAAIRFSAALGAHTAVAISPQYSLDDAVVPLERRWREAAARIRFLPWHEPANPPPAILFHDPGQADGQHAALWAAERPVIAIRLPWAGHPAATFLAEIGLLAPALLAILDDTFDPAAFARTASRRRRHSGAYLSALARAQVPRRPRWAVRLMRGAVAAVPASAVYAGRLASLLYRAGEYDGAEAMHRRAMALNPASAETVLRFVVFLLRLGRFEEARTVSASAVDAHPEWATLRGAGEKLGLAARLRWRGRHVATRAAWRLGGRLVGRLEGRNEAL